LSSPGDGRAPLVSARGISRRFPGVLALDNVDFDVRPGEVHALVGENGAGKSTLINIQAGVSPENILALFETGYEHGFYG